MTGPPVAPGRVIDLPERGRTFLRERAGPDDAPVVVLLHGWTATAALNWAPSFEPLARHFRVLALDHRGHGRGVRSRAPFRLEDCADDVAALLGELDVARCIVVGYSMGGPIAQLLWRRHPRLVDGLVLCATSASFSGTARERLLSGIATSGSLIAGAVPLGALTTLALQLSRGWRNVRGDPWWGFDEIARHDWTRIIQAGREICRFDCRSWIEEIVAPTAVIATRGDEVVPFARQLELAGAVPGASLRVVDGGHTVCTADPRRFVGALVDACAELADRGAGRCRPLAAGDDAA